MPNPSKAKSRKPKPKSRKPAPIERAAAVALRLGQAVRAEEPHPMPGEVRAVVPAQEERTISLPNGIKPPGRPLRYNIRRMEIGDSFNEPIPSDRAALDVYRALRAAISYQIRTLPQIDGIPVVRRRFTVRRNGDAWWCARIA